MLAHGRRSAGIRLHAGVVHRRHGDGAYSLARAHWDDLAPWSCFAKNVVSSPLGHPHCDAPESESQESRVELSGWSPCFEFTHCLCVLATDESSLLSGEIVSLTLRDVLESMRISSRIDLGISRHQYEYSSSIIKCPSKLPMNRYASAMAGCYGMVS